MTVGKYQQVYEISQTTLDDIERVATLICFVFNLDEDKVNNFSELQFLKYADKLNRKLSTKDRWYNWIKLQTDASQITFGQFIETSYWLKNGVLENIHLVAASLVKNWNGISHQEKAERLLNRPIWSVLDQVNQFTESLNKLIKSYPGLFPQPPKPKPGEELPKEEKPHPFLEQYGWIFSATQVADYERIELDKVYSIPIIQALNALSYLKGKQQYDKWLTKQ